MLCTGNRTVGSNPTLSARFKVKVKRQKVKVEEAFKLSLLLPLSFLNFYLLPFTFLLVFAFSA
jgi:hypothetical protein